MFWVRLDTERAGFASGIGFTPTVRERWRAAVGAAAGEELADELDVLIAGRGVEVAGDQVKRVPAPFEDAHPRADLIRRTGFRVCCAEPLPASVDTPGFADWCTGRLEVLLTVHRWRLANLTD